MVMKLILNFNITATCFHVFLMGPSLELVVDY